MVAETCTHAVSTTKASVREGSFRGNCRDYSLLWAWSLIFRSCCSIFDVNSVPATPQTFQSGHILARAEELWASEQWHAAERKRMPSLESSFRKQASGPLLTGIVFSIMHGVLNSVARPLVLRALVAAVSNNEPGTTLSLLAGCLCCILLAEGVTTVFLRQALETRLHALLTVSMAGLAQTHAVRISKAAVGNSSDAGGLVGSDMSRVQGCLWSLAILPAAVVQFVGGTIVLLYSIGLAGVLGLAGMLIVLAVNMCISRRANDAEHENLERADRRLNLLQQMINGMRAVKFCAWEEKYLNAVAAARRAECVPLRRLRVLAQSNVQMGRANPMIGSLLAFVYLALVARDNPDSFRPADIFAALNVFLSLRICLIALPEGIVYTLTLRTCIGRLQQFLLLDPAPCHRQKVEANEERSELCVDMKDALFAWPTSSKATSSETGADSSPQAPPLVIDKLEVHRGTFVAIVGAVGSGKSSLVAAMLGEMPRKGRAGTVSISSNRIGVVPQKAVVLSGTVRSNVELGSVADEVQFKAAIRSAALQKDVARLYGGEQTEVGERGVVLSGGQQQRLSIARAFYSADTDFIVADDPFSALDPEVTNDVFCSLHSFVRDSNGKRTCLVVLNQLHLLPHFDHVLMLADGQVVQEGTPRSLLAQEGPLLRFCRSSGCTVDPSAAPLPQPKLHDSEDLEPKRLAKQLTNGTLVVDEQRPTGAMPFSVLRRYIKGMGYCFFVLCLLLVLLTYCTMAWTDRWLARWVDARERHWAMNEPVDDDLYLTVYGCSIGVFILLLCTTSWSFSVGSVWSSRHLHHECINTILHAPISFFESTPSGRILSRLSSDLAIVDKELSRWVDNNCQIFVTAVTLCVQVTVLVPHLVLVLVLAGPAYAWIVMSVNKTTRELRRCASAAMGPILTTVNEAANCRLVLRTMGVDWLFRERLCAEMDEYLRFQYAGMSCVNCGTLSAYMLAFAISGGTTVFILADRQSYSPSYVALALTYSFNLPYFLNIFSQIFMQLLAALTSLERLLQYGHNGIVTAEAAWTLPGDPNQVSSPTSWPALGGVVFENVSLIYRPGLPKALDGVSFSLNPGEKVGAAGRSGAGKSSLMSVLFRLNEPTEGRILIDGVDITSIGLQTLRTAVAIVPQDPLLISGSVKTNLDPFGEHSEPALEQVLDEVELGASLLHSDALALSHGERQLLTLGRMLLRQAKIRIFDEPTSNIDAGTDRIVQHLLRSAAAFRSSTQLTIAHRLQTIMDCDRVIVMDNGRILEIGPAQQLLSNPQSSLFTLETTQEIREI